MNISTGLKPATFLLLMVLVALNLRPALASLAPLFGRLETELAMGSLALGLLTTIPVLALGIFAPLAPILSRRLGMERTISLALLLLVGALLLRVWPSQLLLFLGTLLAGASIGIAGTLLPVLVKREIAGRADLATGLYTMALCLGGAISAGLSVPLANLFHSWEISIGSWAIFALLVLVIWRMQIPHPWPSQTTKHSQSKLPGLMENPLAWHITLLMACQSSLAYTTFGWLPNLLQQRGIAEAEAGFMLSATVLVQTGAALIAPWLARLGRDQRPALVFLLLLTAAGVVMALMGNDAMVWPGMVLLGIGQGGNFSLALALIVLRSSTPAVATQLSGMVQGIGYFLAAIGPFVVGLLLDMQLGLAWVTGTIVGIIFMAAIMATLAGRRLQLLPDPTSGRIITHPQRH
ncbi:MAG: MFS transporter [Parahaliea sp.]